MDITTSAREGSMLQTVLATTLRLGVATTHQVAHLVVDNTVGRILDTNPHRVR